MRGIVLLSFLTLFVISSGFTQTTTISTKILISPTVKTDWEVYPNPFFQTFTVSSSQKNLQIEVFTLAGQRIPSAIFRNHDGQKAFYQTGLELTKGIYLVRISSGQTYQFYKMMKN